MFDKEGLDAVATLAGTLEVEAAALLAIAQVESGGRAFAVVAGRNEPLIRFEGHYFDQRLRGAKREKARSTGLSSPVAGAIVNPRRQEDRWKLLDRAGAIDRVAALESTSWGVGQVMGAHWRWLGYDSVDQLVAEARSSTAGQIRLMCRYIEKAGVSPALRSHDWKAFARAYNGAGYAANGYDRKIAAAYLRHSGKIAGRPEALASTEVADIQRMLAAAGYRVVVDGLEGPQTRAAIRSFQSANGLVADGIAGPLTLAALYDTQPLNRAGSRLWIRLRHLLSGLFTSG